MNRTLQGPDEDCDFTLNCAVFFNGEVSAYRRIAVGRAWRETMRADRRIALVTETDICCSFGSPKLLRRSPRSPEAETKRLILPRRKQTNEARPADQTRVVDELVAELRQPLTAASNYIGAARLMLCSGEGCDIEGAVSSLGRAEDQILRAATFVHRLRIVSPNETGQFSGSS
ncbi:MAG TPA: hypothetical protein VE221_04305 [Sphingomicrobium sp.]|nr:hypothetical protein [Sphingomicrobium sp.]